MTQNDGVRGPSEAALAEFTHRSLARNTTEELARKYESLDAFRKCVEEKVQYLAREDLYAAWLFGMVSSEHLWSTSPQVYKGRFLKGKRVKKKKKPEKQKGRKK